MTDFSVFVGCLLKGRPQSQCISPFFHLLKLKPPFGFHADFVLLGALQGRMCYICEEVPAHDSNGLRTTRPFCALFPAILIAALLREGFAIADDYRVRPNLKNSHGKSTKA